MTKDELRRAAEAAWQDPEALHPLVAAAIAAREPADAVVVARQLLAIDPDRTRATATYADALAADGQHREAYVVLSEAYARRGLDGPWARRRMAELLRRLGQPEQGRQQLWIALTLDPNDPETVEAWVGLYASAGGASAQAELVRLADDLGSGVAAARLVRAHLRGGDDEGAIERAEQALEQRDDDGDVVVTLTDVLAGQGRHDLVVDVVAPAVDPARDGARPCMAVARAHAALGRRGEASRWLALAEQADDPRVAPEIAALRASLG